MTSPRYWKGKTSGALRPAVEAYLRNEPMSQDHVAAMRAYLRQWIDAPVWQGPKVQPLREAIDGLTSRETIAAWLAVADKEGIDPL